MTHFVLMAREENSDRTYYDRPEQIAGRIRLERMHGAQFATIEDACEKLETLGYKIEINDGAYPTAQSSAPNASRTWFIQLKNNMRIGNGCQISRVPGNMPYQGSNHPGNIVAVMETLSRKRGALTDSERNYLKLAAEDIRHLAKIAGVVIL